MKSTIVIPKKCKVGFNERKDTYTGLLGYVIYHDGKVWRKEDGWEKWREKYISSEEFEENKLKAFEVAKNNYIRQFERNIEQYNSLKENPPVENKNPQQQYSFQNQLKYYEQNLESYKKTTEAGLDDFLKRFHVDNIKNFNYQANKTSSNEKLKVFEFDNTPTSGFVLNKKVGGHKSDWNVRQTYSRVYDPRGFEFEITIPNLLYILENANSIKGKGLEGNFIYGWDGKDLVLIPEEAPEYKDMLEFTKTKDLKSIAKKDLVLGGVYMCADGIEKTYLDESDHYTYSGRNEGKKLWFGYETTGYGNSKYFVFEAKKALESVKRFVRMNDDYASLMDELSKDSHYKKRGTTYEKVVSINTGDYYGTETFFLKEKEKFKKIIVKWKKEYRNVFRQQETVFTVFTVNDEQFTDAKSLLNKYELWEQKTTKLSSN